MTMEAKAINASLAYAKALGRISENGGGDAVSSAGPSFSDLLKGYAEEAMTTTKAAEQGAIRGVAGGKVDLVDIVQAATSAEVTVETVTALRDRVIGAYQDIMKMPI